MVGSRPGKRNPLDQLPQWVPGAQSPREPREVIEPHGDRPMGDEGVGVFILQPLSHCWRAAGVGAIP